MARPAFSAPVLVSSVRQTGPAPGQMSHPNGFAAGRPRQLRVVPVIDKGAFMSWWAALLRRRLGGDAVAISQTFGCTEQTGRNWLAEFACPTGSAVDLAMELWPADFAARHGRGEAVRSDRVRRAA